MLSSPELSFPRASAQKTGWFVIYESAGKELTSGRVVVLYAPTFQQEVRPSPTAVVWPEFVHVLIIFCSMSAFGIIKTTFPPTGSPSCSA